MIQGARWSCANCEVLRGDGKLCLGSSTLSGLTLLPNLPFRIESKKVPTPTANHRQSWGNLSVPSKSNKKENCTLNV